LAALVVVAVFASLFTFGPLGPAARQQRLQNKAVALYTAMMTDWVKDEPNTWTAGAPTPEWYDEYLVDPAWGGQMAAHSRLSGDGASVTSVGAPYFTVTKWAALADANHTDALVGLTVCWVQGNLVTRTVFPQQPATGPGPTGHVAQVFFKNSRGKDGSRSALRIYDIKDVTPDAGSCPLG